VKARLVLSLGVVYLVWGSTFLAVGVSDRSLPPLLMLAVRFLLAGTLLYAWSARCGDVRAARPGLREWRAAAMVGGVLLFLNTGAVAWAEQRVASGLTALLIGSVPLFTAVIDRTFFRVRMSLGTLLGIAVGLFGVALLVGSSAHIDPVGAGVILGAALTWAAGSAYARVAPLPPQPMLAAAMQMLCGGVLLAVAGVALGEPAQIRPGSISTASVGAFAYLVVFGSIVAYTAYGWLLRSGTSSVLVSTYAYVNPAVAVVLGWALVGEHVGYREIAAGMVILASVGMLLATRLPREHAGPLAKRLSGLGRAGA
jgi:drug/metabolite transporter (DMT)-like permease